MKVKNLSNDAEVRSPAEVMADVEKALLKGELSGKKLRLLYNDWVHHIGWVVPGMGEYARFPYNMHVEKVAREFLIGARERFLQLRNEVEKRAVLNPATALPIEKAGHYTESQVRARREALGKRKTRFPLGKVKVLGLGYPEEGLHKVARVALEQGDYQVRRGRSQGVSPNSCR